MNSNEIKSALVMKGITQTAIAKSLNIKQPAVNATITGDLKTQRIRAAIAMAINKPVSEIWPDTSTKEKI